MLMIAVAVSITFVQEQALNMLPNIAFTVVLIVVFTSVFTFKESMVYIFVYTFLDCLYWGTLDILTMAPLFIGWSLIPISYHTILRKTRSEYKLAIFGIIFGFVFGWVFIPFQMLKLGITEIWPYILADIWFEVLMAACGGLTILWLYKPLTETLNKILQNDYKLELKSQKIGQK